MFLFRRKRLWWCSRLLSWSLESPVLIHPSVHVCLLNLVGGWRLSQLSLGKRQILLLYVISNLFNIYDFFHYLTLLLHSAVIQLIRFCTTTFVLWWKIRVATNFPTKLPKGWLQDGAWYKVAGWIEDHLNFSCYYTGLVYQRQDNIAPGITLMQTCQQQKGDN